jgi:hypothetical protein
VCVERERERESELAQETETYPNGKKMTRWWCEEFSMVCAGKSCSTITNDPVELLVV